jgi:hypothetical protein
MRRWGRAPIYKAFRPDHELGIQAKHNLVDEGKKGRHGGHMKTCEEKQGEESVHNSLVQEITEKRVCSGHRKWLAGLWYKLINENDE